MKKVKKPVKKPVVKKLTAKQQWDDYHESRRGFTSYQIIPTADELRQDKRARER